MQLCTYQIIVISRHILHTRMGTAKYKILKLVHVSIYSSTHAKTAAFSTICIDVAAYLLLNFKILQHCSCTESSIFANIYRYSYTFLYYVHTVSLSQTPNARNIISFIARHACADIASFCVRTDAIVATSSVVCALINICVRHHA